MSQFKTPREVNFNAENLAEEWRRWEKSFKIYYAASELHTKPIATQIAILLNCAGEEARDIFDNFSISLDDENLTTDIVLDRYKVFCNPRRRPVFDAYKFWQRQQAVGELFDKWLTELRLIANNCDFGAFKDRLVRDKILFGTNDETARQRMLEEEDLTLEKAINICRSIEVTKARMQYMSNEKINSSLVQEIKKDRYPSFSASNTSVSNKPCRFCDLVHLHRQCPAYGKTCRKCGKYNHFAVVCRSFKSDTRNIKEITSEIQADSTVFQMCSLQSKPTGSKMRSTLTVLDHHNNTSTLSFKLDTGAEVNVLPLSLYKQMRLAPFSSTSTILRGFGNALIKPLGAVEMIICDRTGRKFSLIFFVTDIIHTPILGEHACELLNLVKKIEDISESSNLTLDMVTNNFLEVFSGTGLYKEKYNITLRDDAKPVIQQPRHIAYALRPKLKATLERLTRDGMVADVDCPTEWVSNLVVVEKKDKSLRLCLDPKPLNAAIMRERYVIPTPADVQAQLCGKRVFSVIDMKDGYWHVGLTEKSSFLTTFHTPWGRKRFLRMPFGLCSASEVMQKRNESTFGNIKGVHIIADDIIIAAEDEKEHDAIMLALLSRARESGVRFNREKIQFKVNSVSYMGHFVTKEGLMPDDQKIDAIVNMPPPIDVPSLQRFLGMTKYLSQYIPNESSITAPLRKLLKKNSEWTWDNEHDEAIAKLKLALISKPVLAFYDVNKAVTVQCDASQDGLGACLIQEGKPVAFASRSLSPAERNYAQIEKELLSIVFACEKFHQYVYGHRAVTIESDHRPLESGNRTV